MARFMNWHMATTSSTVKGIMTSMVAAAARQSVHQAPTATGWSATSTMCVIPSGITRLPPGYVMSHPRHHRDQDRERDGERANQRIIQVPRGAGRPEYERRELKPNAHNANTPAAPEVVARVRRQRPGAERHEKDTAQH